MISSFKIPGCVSFNDLCIVHRVVSALPKYLCHVKMREMSLAPCVAEVAVFQVVHCNLG